MIVVPDCALRALERSKLAAALRAYPPQLGGDRRVDRAPQFVAQLLQLVHLIRQSRTHAGLECGRGHTHQRVGAQGPAEARGDVPRLGDGPHQSALAQPWRRSLAAFPAELGLCLAPPRNEKDLVRRQARAFDVLEVPVRPAVALVQQRALDGGERDVPARAVRREERAAEAAGGARQTAITLGIDGLVVPPADLALVRHDDAPEARVAQEELAARAAEHAVLLGKRLAAAADDAIGVALEPPAARPAQYPLPDHPGLGVGNLRVDDPHLLAQALGLGRVALRHAPREVGCDRGRVDERISAALDQLQSLVEVALLASRAAPAKHVCPLFLSTAIVGVF